MKRKQQITKLASAYVWEWAQNKNTNLIYRNKNLRYMINDMAFEYDILPIQFTICMIYYFMVLLRIGINILCTSSTKIISWYQSYFHLSMLGRISFSFKLFDNLTFWVTFSWVKFYHGLFILRMMIKYRAHLI